MGFDAAVLADERPFILATNLIPQALFVGKLIFMTAIYPCTTFLRQYCQQTIAYAIYEISPVLADDEKDCPAAGLPAQTKAAAICHHLLQCQRCANCGAVLSMIRW
ncbi:MAG: hypothetical protein IPJ90_23925 [Anaerolineaceae bacterium]|nr:hypothetical protein [Anaerolineaceae bacterium]